MRERRRMVWLIATAIVTGIFFLTGCAVGGPGGPGEPEEQPPTTTEETGERTYIDNPLGESRPPESTLSYRGRTVTGVLGSYCWGSVCTDMAGVPIPPSKDVLAVPSGSNLVFDFGGGQRYKAEVSVIPFDRQAKTVPGPGGTRLLVPDESAPSAGTGNLRAIREGRQTRIIAELPAGEYIVSVFVDPGQGDVSYYYRIVVEPESGETTTTEAA